MTLPHIIVGQVIYFWALPGRKVQAVIACLHESRLGQVFICRIVTSADPTVGKLKKAEEGLKGRESRHIPRMRLKPSLFSLATHSKYSSEE